MLDLQLTPFRELRTPRLRLRQLDSNDAQVMHLLRTDPAVIQHLQRAPEASVADTQAHLRLLDELLQANQGIVWAMCRPADPTLLGTICLWNLQPTNHRAEVGYALHPASWGQGLMSEALAAVLQYGFEELNLHSIEANTCPENTASWRLLERHGFVREGHLRENHWFEGRFYDTLIYSRLAGTVS